MKPDLRDFFEPFVGGGAFMLSLTSNSGDFAIPGNKLVLSDINPDLITTYTVIRDYPKLLIDKLSKIERPITKELYDEVRYSQPTSAVGIAARFIFLNKTCFNGIWRVNSKGEFNVPWSKNTSPKIFDSENIFSVSRRIEGAKILNESFEKVLKLPKSGDLVYLDPPYLPTSAPTMFSAYSKEGFTIEMHSELAALIQDLTSRGVFVILSNSYSDLTYQIYGPHLNIKTVDLQRTISGRNHGRTKVTEIIGTNSRRIK